MPGRLLAELNGTGDKPFDGRHDLAVGEAPGPVDRQTLPDSLPVLGPTVLEHAGPPQLARRLWAPGVLRLIANEIVERRRQGGSASRGRPAKDTLAEAGIVKST